MLFKHGKFTRLSLALTATKRRALEAELRHVKGWCVTALAGVPIKSVEYRATSALLDGVLAGDARALTS
jgi:hypothetical protein